MKINRLIMHNIVWVLPIPERKKTAMSSFACRLLTYNVNSNNAFILLGLMV